MDPHRHGDIMALSVITILAVGIISFLLISAFTSCCTGAPFIKLDRRATSISPPIFQPTPMVCDFRESSCLDGDYPLMSLSAINQSLIASPQFYRYKICCRAGFNLLDVSARGYVPPLRLPIRLLLVSPRMPQRQDFIFQVMVSKSNYKFKFTARDAKVAIRTTGSCIYQKTCVLSLNDTRNAFVGL